MSEDQQRQRLNRHADEEQDTRSRPGIPAPGLQQDQQQQTNAPPQPTDRRSCPSQQWIAPRTGNPDLDPAFGSGPQVNLRERDPLMPQGMLYDPRQLLEARRGPGNSGSGSMLPPGARFDPFGPPDPSQVGPGRGPTPSSQFGDPDPDHFAPPGMPDPFGSGRAAKSFKGPWPPGGFPPPGGAGGSPFL